MYVSGLLQAAALDVVTQPGWQTHLRSLRQQLQSRRDLLVTSLREHAPQAHIELLPKGGLNLWLRLPDGTDLRPAHRATARTTGVHHRRRHGVVPGGARRPVRPAQLLRPEPGGVSPRCQGDRRGAGAATLSRRNGV